MSTKVLIVDDNDGVRSSLRNWLSLELAPCEVFEAADGEQALALSKANYPDVVVMDLRLPGMNGIETTRQIKAVCPNTQVLMLTIHDGMEYRRDAHEAGVSAYIVKARMHTELLPALNRDGRRSALSGGNAEGTFPTPPQGHGVNAPTGNQPAARPDKT